MQWNWDLLLIVNLGLCIVILLLGIGRFRKEWLFPLLIGLAFGLFAVTHLFSIMGLSSGWETLLIVLRVLAYLLVIGALTTARPAKR